MDFELSAAILPIQWNFKSFNFLSTLDGWYLVMQYSRPIVIDSGRKCLAVNVSVEDDGKVIFTRIDN
jgi:hypothetical protein